MMSEEQQNRIADLFLKHLQGRLTEDENEELQKILASNKSVRISFETISDPEKLTNLVAKRKLKIKRIVRLSKIGSLSKLISGQINNFFLSKILYQ